jgi:hypothetical protein
MAAGSGLSTAATDPRPTISPLLARPGGAMA